MAKILYFAWLRDAIGTGEEDFAIPTGVRSLRDLAGALARQSEGHARAFHDLTRVRAAIDLVMAAFDDPVADASEIAFFPPVTGG